VNFVATVSEGASLIAPDIAHRPDVPRQSRPATKFRPAALFDQGQLQRFIKMTSSSAGRGSKLRKSKPSVTPGALTGRFLELEQLGKRFLELRQLRSQVRELEHLAANARQRGPRCGRTGGGPRRK